MVPDSFYDKLVISSRSLSCSLFECADNNVSGITVVVIAKVTDKIRAFAKLTSSNRASRIVRLSGCLTFTTSNKKYVPDKSTVELS